MIDTNQQKRFALIGVAGFIAPRHLKAIKENGHNLIACMDKHDNVGIIDSYFPDADFFTEFERFDRHLEMLRRNKNGVDYVTICTPNYLHDAHIRFALRNHAHAICEKPLVLNPWNIDALTEIENETGKKVYTILQLRHHQAVIELRNRVLQQDPSHRYEINLEYITSRGKWYDYSWKADLSKSGGVGTNMGIHFFDMLIWIFGKPLQSEVSIKEARTMAGTLKLERANVNWKLSVDYAQLPEAAKQKGMRTYRSLMLDGEAFEFSEGFTDLHTVSYKHILAGEGYGLADAREAILLAHSIRNA